MYHFVFQNAKHRMNRYDPRRTVPHSTRGNFNLDHLRKTLGDDHTVYGFGRFPLQQVLWSDYRTDRVMLGHVIAVKQPRTAMWIRLNHENFCRNDVRLIEFYQDLDIDWLTEQSLLMKLNDKERSSCQNRNSTISSLVNNLHRLVSQGDINGDDPIGASANSDIDKYQEMSYRLDERVKAATQRSSDIMEQLKQHFDSRHTQVKTG